MECCGASHELKRQGDPSGSAQTAHALQWVGGYTVRFAAMSAFKVSGKEGSWV